MSTLDVWWGFGVRSVVDVDSGPFLYKSLSAEMSKSVEAPYSVDDDLSSFNHTATSMGRIALNLEKIYEKNEAEEKKMADKHRAELTKMRKKYQADRVQNVQGFAIWAILNILEIPKSSTKVPKKLAVKLSEYQVTINDYTDINSIMSVKSSTYIEDLTCCFGCDK
jgi:hypothetical protein